MPQTIEKIGQQSPDTGRFLKEDSTTINLADVVANAVDPLGGITFYDEMQHAIHLGTAYSFSAHGTVAGNSTYTFIGRVTTKQVHFDGMNVGFQAGGVLVELLEAPTVSVLGTLQTVRRKNRATPKAVTMSVYAGATITGGTMIFDTLPPIVSGQGNKIESASTGIVQGWVLAQNTDYAIRFTNTTATAITFDANFGWHEPSIVLS